MWNMCPIWNSCCINDFLQPTEFLGKRRGGIPDLVQPSASEEWEELHVMRLDWCFTEV